MAEEAIETLPHDDDAAGIDAATEDEEIGKLANTETPGHSAHVPGELKSIKEITAKLTCPTGNSEMPIPKRLIVYKVRGGKKFPGIEHTTVVKFLDLYAPGWSYRITESKTEALGVELPVEVRGNTSTQRQDRAVVRVAISIPSKEGMVTRDGLGVCLLNEKVYGDAFFTAEAQAIKRAAMRFGLGSHFYLKPKKEENER